MKLYIDLDIAFDDDEPVTEETVRNAVLGIIAEADVEVDTEMISMSGSGGGWPEVRFIGTREELVQVYAAYDVGKNGGDVGSTIEDADAFVDEFSVAVAE